MYGVSVSLQQILAARAAQAGRICYSDADTPYM